MPGFVPVFGSLDINFCAEIVFEGSQTINNVRLDLGFFETHIELEMFDFLFVTFLHLTDHPISSRISKYAIQVFGYWIVPPQGKVLGFSIGILFPDIKFGISHIALKFLDLFAHNSKII